MMSEFRGREFKIIVAVFLLSGSFLFLGSAKKVSAAFINDYNKSYNGTLTSAEWNNLALDFLNKSGAATMTGPLGIGTSSPASGLEVNGPIVASNFSGFLTGGIDAANVMGGNGSIFGSNFGSGATYSFSGKVGIGTTNPGAKLDVQNLTSSTTPALALLGSGSYGSGYQMSWGNYSKLSQASSGMNYITWGAYHNGATWQRSYNGGVSGLVNLQIGTGNYFSIQTDAQTSPAAPVWTNVFTVNGTNVGIGTTNPGAKLDVVGGVSPWLGIRVGDNNSATYPESVHIGQVTNMYGYIGSGRYQISNNWQSPYTSAANIRFNDDGSMAFTTNNGLTANTNYTPTTRMTIDNAGNVGIGTTNPGATLDVDGVVGSLRANSATISNIGAGLIMSDAAGNLYSTSTAVATGIPLPGGIAGQTLRSDGTNWVANSLLYNNGTNVGIGTTSPGAKLDVIGKGIFGNGISLNRSSSVESLNILEESGVQTALRIWEFGVASSKIGHKAGDSSLYITNDYYGTGLGVASSSIALTRSGYVGIGTTNPVSKLALSNSTSTFLTISNTANVTGPVGGILFSSQLESTYRKGAVSFVRSESMANRGFLSFALDSSATNSNVDSDIVGNTKMAINYLGNVGIGMTNPGATLDVGGTNASFRAKSATLSNIGSGVIMADASGNLYSTSTAVATGIPSPAGISGQTLRSDGTNWVANSLLFNNGTNIGIGTTNATSKLTVSGNIEIKGNPSSTRYILTDETGTGTTQLTMQSGAGSAAYGGAINLFAHAHTTKPGWVTVGISSGAGTAGTATEGRFTVNNQGLAGGTDLLTVLRTGNVGIGTTAPQNKLTVGQSSTGAGYGGTDGTGGVRVAWTSGYGVGMDAWDGASPHWGIVKYSANTPTVVMEGMHSNNNVIFNAGNVGIGTTNPSTTLDVGGAIASFRAKSATLSNIGSGVIMADASGNLYSTSTAVATGIPSPAGISGQTLRSDGTNWVANNFLYNSGTSIGIGTTNPGVYKLNVSGSAFFNAAVTASSSLTILKSGSYANLAVTGNSNVNWEGSRIEFNRSRGVSGAKTAVASGDTIGWFDYFAYDGAADQRVAQFKVDVDGAVSSGIVPGKFVITTADSAGAVKTRLTAYANDNIVMATNSGNVGIGTTNPGATLDVGGTIASFRAKSATLSNIGAGLIMADVSGNLYSTSTAVATGIPSPAGIAGQTLRSDGTNWIANSLLYNNGTNIGVGTTSVTYKLEVDGSFGATSNSSSIILDTSGNILIGI